jgi:hypothetical protein
LAANSAPVNADILELCQSFSQQQHKDRPDSKFKGIKKQFRPRKSETLSKRKNCQGETMNLGVECFPKSGNQSTGVGEKEELGGR